MSFNINDLKKISQSTSQVIADSDSKKKYAPDERFWKLDRDAKTGNGAAVIRFLPSLKEGELPWVKTYSYFLQNPKNKKWYVEQSRRTLGEPDPMREYISSLWNNAASDIQKDELRKNFRERMQYICNVLIVNDPSHPELNGTVKLYSFGAKIMDKIIAKTSSEFPDDACNVFDWVSGENFKLKATMVGGYVNYDRSEFASPSAVDDATIEKAAASMYDLHEFVDPKNFKSYDELAKKVYSVYPPNGEAEESAPTTVARTTVPAQEDDAPWENKSLSSSEDDAFNSDALLAEIEDIKV